ncbi:MAG: VOC family protein [Gemmatimonadales bacterium]|nr:VOC family protein [Gemmatimonadales bacterium]
MRRTTKPPAGAFCWFELGTTDAKAADAFYGRVFGWSVEHNDMGPGGLYHMYSLHGANVAAAWTMPPEMRAQGIPPHWLVYIAVDDADAAAAAVTRLGGTVLNGPFDVEEHGRMVMAKDPGGAAFALWQAKRNIGIGIAGEPGSMCWSELATRDAAQAIAFYTGLVPWTPKASSTSPAPSYTEWLLDGASIGGMLPMSAEWGDMAPHWMTYIMVDDADATCAAIRAAGGSVPHGPFDAPGVGRLAVCADPQGAHFSVIRLAM